MIKELQSILPDVASLVVEVETRIPSHHLCEQVLAYDRLLVSAFNYILAFKTELNNRKNANPDPKISELTKESDELLKSVEPEHQLVLADLKAFKESLRNIKG